MKRPRHLDKASSFGKNIDMKLATVSMFLALAASPAFADETAKATFSGEDGNPIGEATLQATPAGILIAIDVRDMPPGKWVAFHVHETGTCDAMAHFDSAGGHFNPTGAEHGFLAAAGPHAGDMPNQLVGPDGTIHAQVLNAMVSLDGGANAIRGRALMIHAGEDDYKSQPAGNAGQRLACAVIE
jgi:Cu-Zn family superoxide dismutase